MHLAQKLVTLKDEMKKLAAHEKRMLASPDEQVSLTDPDSRSMATSGRGSGVVGYNVQTVGSTGQRNMIYVTLILGERRWREEYGQAFQRLKEKSFGVAGGMANP